MALSRWMWPGVLATFLTPSTLASNALARRHRQPEPPPVPASTLLELNELKAHVASIHDKLTLGAESQGDCASLGKALADLALAPVPEARQVVADGIKVCTLDVPIANSERGLQAAVAEMAHERQRSDPDQMAPYWVELKASCDEANKTLKAVSGAGFADDAKTKALSEDVATDCVAENLGKPERHSTRWALVVLSVLGVLLTSVVMAAGAYLWQKRRHPLRPGTG